MSDSINGFYEIGFCIFHRWLTRALRKKYERRKYERKKSGSKSPNWQKV